MRDPHYPAGEDGRRFLKVESPEARFFVELVNTGQTPVQPRAILHGTAAQCLYPELPPSLARLISPATVRRAFFLADLERPGQQRPRLAIGGTRSRFIRERRLNEHQKQRPEYIPLSIVNGNPTDLFKASISKHSTSYGSSPPQQAVGSRLGDPRRTVPKGEKIFKEGEKADFFYRVASGVVRTCTALNDGRRIINDFHFADDILGLDPGAQHRFSATSVCDAVVTSFRRSDLDGILACDKDLGRQVQSSLVVSLGRAQDHLVLLGLRTAGEKIQAFLGSMAQRASRSGIQKLQMQQSDIADYLGLSRETVSRALTSSNLERSRARHRG